MPRYKLTVAYDGTDFHGWQKQAKAGVADPEHLRTVQGVLEDAARLVVREPISLVGASRTDSGVHAKGQVAAFSSDRTIAPKKMVLAINARLPEDVQVQSARLVAPDFNPIAGATSKGYRYRLAHGGMRPLFDRRGVAFTPYELDPVRMHDAAQRLIGEHDFASLTKKHHGREHTVRTVLDCSVTASGPRRLRIDVSGTGFLYNMVRIIAGTLVEVGRGRIEPEQIDEILAAKDRTASGPTMPPEGLWLEWIRY